MCLLLVTQPTGSPQALIGRLRPVPGASHAIRFHSLLFEMQHRLKQVVVEPHLLVESIHGGHLLRSIQPQRADLLPHQAGILLFDEPVIIFVIGPTA